MLILVKHFCDISLCHCETGKYAMKDLVANLPVSPHNHDISSDTVAAVLATLNEVVKKNSEFAQ